MANNDFKPTNPPELKFKKYWLKTNTADPNGDPFSTYAEGEDTVRGDLQKLFDDIVAHLENKGSGGYAKFVLDNDSLVYQDLQNQIRVITSAAVSKELPDKSVEPQFLSDAVREAIPNIVHSTPLYSANWVPVSGDLTATIEVHLSGLQPNSTVTLYPASGIAPEALKALQLAGLVFDGFVTSDNIITRIKLKALGKQPTCDIPVVFVVDNSANTLQTDFEELDTAPLDWDQSYYKYYYESGGEKLRIPYDEAEGAPKFDASDTLHTRPRLGDYYKLVPITPPSSGAKPFINAVGDYVDPAVLKADGIVNYVQNYVSDTVTTAINDLLGASL